MCVNGHEKKNGGAWDNTVHLIISGIKFAVNVHCSELIISFCFLFKTSPKRLSLKCLLQETLILPRIIESFLLLHGGHDILNS